MGLDRVVPDEMLGIDDAHGTQRGKIRRIYDLPGRDSSRWWGWHGVG